MRYLLIRNIRLANLPPDQPPTSILVSGGRIVGIGQNLQHPLIDTDNLDAGGRYVIPALIDICKQQPKNFTPDLAKTLNFENITTGITTIITVANDVEENIDDFEKQDFRKLNYSFHIPLRQVNEANRKKLRRLMVTNGIASSFIRFNDDAKSDIHSLEQNIATATAIGLVVVYDFRFVPSSLDRLAKLECLSEVLRKVDGSRSYILGIETTDEFRIVEELRQHADVKAHICFNPFEPYDENSNRLAPDGIAAILRHDDWTSLGLASCVSRALKEHWPDTTPEIIFRNKLPLLNAIQATKPLTPDELAEFTVGRVADFLGLRPPLARVSEGMSANLIIWDPDQDETVVIEMPGGAQRHIKLSGRIDYVVMNGQVVMGEKFIQQKVCGQHVYARVV